MIRFSTPFKSVLLLGICILLSGCLGGTVAQQIARSIATSMADSAVANAMDVQELDEQDRFSPRRKTDPIKNPPPQQNFLQQTLASQNAINQNPITQNLINQNTAQQNLALQHSALQNLATPNVMQQNSLAQKNTPAKELPVDAYKLAFINARFEEVKPIAEPLPTESVEIETPVAVVQSSQLVPVELFNLLIGEEKAAVYTKAQLLGATSLPKLREWKLWRVATGMIKTSNTKNPATRIQDQDPDQNQQIITFLIPPDFGKLPSGSTALVEIASPGELNIARYKIN